MATASPAMADASTKAPISRKKSCASRWRFGIPVASRPGRVSDALTCGTDIAPTILDAAGLQFERPVDGQSLLPLATGNATGRQSLLVETYGHGFGTVELGRAIIKGHYKYVAWQDHDGELYDLEADPYELNNLYHQPAHQSTLAEMETELRRWLRDTGDTDFDQPISDDFRAADNERFQELLKRRARVNHAGD